MVRFPSGLSFRRDAQVGREHDQNQKQTTRLVPGKLGAFDIA